jgi:hypothetical protein
MLIKLIKMLITSALFAIHVPAGSLNGAQAGCDPGVPDEVSSVKAGTSAVATARRSRQASTRTILNCGYTVILHRSFEYH